MSSTPHPIEVEAFEQIKASSRTVLLRLIFRAPGEGRTPISRLVVNNHYSTHRVAPLPSLPAPGGAERAAFAVPYELLKGDRTFCLELEDGALIELPYPMAASTVPAVPAAASAAISRAHRASAAAHRSNVQGGESISTTTEVLTADSEGLAEERLLAETEARGEAEDEVVTLRSELAQLRAQAEEQARALGARAGDLERRLAEALAELEAVTKAERRAVREAYQLKEKVAQQAALIDERQSRPD
jgi:hypothetical protein